MNALAGPAAAHTQTIQAPILTGRDLVLALVVALGALAIYAALALRLAQGQYADFYNLAFDFDPPRYVALLALEEYERGNVKHPLTWFLRPLAWPLLAAGLGPKQAAGLVMSGLGAATVAVVFLYLRSLSVTTCIAAALAVLFAVSGCQVFTAIIPEAYGPAAFGIACVWLLAIWRLADPRHASRLRFALATVSYGITTTNILQPMVAEALVWWRHRGLRGAVIPMIRYGLIVALCCAVLTAIVWFDVLRQFLSDPAAVAKEVYWQRTKGDRVGLVDVILRLIGYTMVSPEFSSLRLPEGIAMWDFREPRFGAMALAATLLWHVFWLVGAIAAFRTPATRWLAFGLAATLAMNVIFHMDFQYRGSVYLYAGHTHFLVFALGAGLAPALERGSRAARAYLGAVIVLILLVGSVTVERTRVFVSGFDAVKVDCPAPCTE